ncbi:MAG: XRE family transcriptional regulator [Pseudomonadota bacterium]
MAEHDDHLSAPTKPQVLVEAGLTARTVRLDLGLTLEEVCNSVGISKGHLSRFERGEKNLSPSSLEKLAQALETSVDRLNGRDIPDDWIIHVKRADRELEDVSLGGKVQYQYAGLSKLAQTADTYLIELPEDDQPSHTAPQAGHQGMFMLNGTVELVLAERRVLLHEGDWIEFPAHLPHTLQSQGGPARFLLTVAAL